MSMKKTLLSVVAMTTLFSGLTLSTYDAFAQRSHGYACKGTSAFFYAPLKKFVAQHTSDIVQERYLFKKIEMWDAAYIKAGCKALLDGKPWDDSCLNGRRNLNEVLETVPDNLNELSRAQTFKIFEPIQFNRDQLAAFEFCRANNVY